MLRMFFFLSICAIIACQDEPKLTFAKSTGLTIRHVSDLINIEIDLQDCIKCEQPWIGLNGSLVYEATIANNDTTFMAIVDLRYGREKNYQVATNTRISLPIHIDQLSGNDCTNFVDTFFVMKVDSLAFSVISGCDRIAVFCPLNDKVDLWIDVVGSNHLEYVKNLIKTVQVYE